MNRKFRKYKSEEPVVQKERGYKAASLRVSYINAWRRRPSDPKFQYAEVDTKKFKTEDISRLSISAFNASSAISSVRIPPTITNEASIFPT
jgi:hypothetical protein